MIPWLTGCSFEDAFGGRNWTLKLEYSFGDMGRFIIYQQKDVSSLPAKALVPLYQPMLKHNRSHPSIAAVVVIDLQLALELRYLEPHTVSSPKA